MGGQINTIRQNDLFRGASGKRRLKVVVADFAVKICPTLSNFENDKNKLQYVGHRRLTSLLYRSYPSTTPWGCHISKQRFLEKIR